MISFRARRLQELRLSARTVRLMMDITELKGHQQLQARLAKQFLRAFRLAALVRGVESANRIEGVAVQSGRLLPLLLYHVKPNNQSEIETLGFCRALDELIYTKTSGFEITPMYLQMLHQTILGGIPGAGEWRAEKSDEIQFGDDDTPGIMVESVSGAEVPGSVEELLRSYRDVQAEPDVHPLLATAVLVLDFLCLHPFYRGNLRMMHLVALLGLWLNGFTVGQYVSLGRWFERTRTACSSAVRLSSEGWRQGRHDLDPWLEYFFGVLRAAYLEFEMCVQRTKSHRLALTGLVETGIEVFPGAFRVRQLQESCPGILPLVIFRTLRELKARGVIRRIGPGSYIVQNSQGLLQSRLLTLQPYITGY